VSKTLAVDGNKMRYTFQIDRKEEADGVRVVSPQGETRGLGLRRNYAYVSVFDGQRGKTRLSSLTDSPPEANSQAMTNVDAQNLDTRVIMMALRPLDPVMGHLLYRSRGHQSGTDILQGQVHDAAGGAARSVRLENGAQGRAGTGFPGDPVLALV